MLRFKTYIRYLEERMKGGMPPGEWAKPNSNTKTPRIDILRLLMKTGEAMPKVDGTEIIVKNTPENRAAVDRLEKANRKWLPDDYPPLPRFKVTDFIK